METKRSSFNNSPAWQKGHSGEHTVAQLLKDSGWYVIPSYDYTGDEGNKAPRLHGISGFFVIPDIDVSRDGERRWAEVKTKESATLHRKSGTLVHGFSLKHFQDYLRVQEITGCEVHVFIYEHDTDDVLVASLECLSKNIHHEYTPAQGKKMGRHGMVFFDRKTFRLWRNLNEASIPAGVN